MKLGDKVKFQKELQKSKSRIRNISDEMIQFAKNRGVSIKNGLKWSIYDNKTVLSGVICGKRNIDMNGSFSYDDGFCFGKSTSVYLVATNLTGFHRVPEEFLITDASLS